MWLIRELTVRSFALCLSYFKQGPPQRIGVQLHISWKKAKYNYCGVRGLFGTCQLPVITPKVGPIEGYAFIHYSLTSKAYHFLNLETSSPHAIVESSLASFFWNYFAKKVKVFEVATELSHNLKSKTSEPPIKLNVDRAYWSLLLNQLGLISTPHGIKILNHAVKLCLLIITVLAWIYWIRDVFNHV